MISNVPRSGRIAGKDRVYNLVDLLNNGVSPVSDRTYNISNYAPMGDKIIGEDGRIYSLVELLSNVGIGNGGSVEPKDYLMVMLTEHTDIMKGDIVLFDTVTFGTIPYDTSSGSVILEAGKVYKITLDIAAMGNGWSVYGMLEASTTTEAPEEGFFPLLLQGTINSAAVSSNSRSFIFIPNSTREFHIVLTSATDEESAYQVRSFNSSLTITEI